MTAPVDAPPANDFYERLNAYLAVELPRGEAGCFDPTAIPNYPHGGGGPVYRLLLPSGKLAYVRMDEETAHWFDISVSGQRYRIQSDSTFGEVDTAVIREALRGV